MRFSPLTSGALGAFLALLPALGAEAVAQEAQTDAGAKELATLLVEHEATELGYVEAYRAFRPRFEAFAAAQRGTEPEARATLWLVQGTWWLKSEGKMESTSMPLATSLLERHPKSPQLGLLIEYQYVFPKAEKQALFGKILEVSPHREVQASAHFGLARLGAARLADGEPNPHYAALLESYADVRWRETTFGKIADAYLNPLSPEDLAVGKQAPEIVGVDQSGKPMKLSDFRGKVVLLDFWGDWGGPCRAMYPHERSLVETYRDQPFAIVGVNSDPTPAFLREVMQTKDLTWSSFFDGGGTGGPIATKWGVRGWPTVYVLDHKGVIRKKGRRNLDDLIAELVRDAQAAR